MEGRAVCSYSVLHSYVFREFLLSLLGAFLFFFFIFFVNQLLLFAQRILLKNVDIASLIRLVVYAVPQILLYTIPFSSLSAASMTIGELSARNEILAFRALGISLKHLFSPILAMGAILALLTFFVADILMPASSQKYRNLYAKLLQDLPTLELESYSVNRIGSLVLITGKVSQDRIEDFVILDLSDTNEGRVVSATGGTVALVDPQSFLYQFDLEQPVILLTDQAARGEYSLAKAHTMIQYIDFSDQIARVADVTPSQLSTKDLLEAIKVRKADLADTIAVQKETLHMLLDEQAQAMVRLGEPDAPSSLVDEIAMRERKIEQLKSQKPISFYLQYYRAELHKKFALSASCVCLILVALPLSFARVKHGRLFGFGLSLLVACAYWFLLFFAQLHILDVAWNPGFLIWAPNIIVIAAAAILFLHLRRI